MEITIRPRRRRVNDAIRQMVQETHIGLNNLVYPLFLVDGKSKKIEIASMPNIFRLSIDEALKEIETCLKLGLKNFILFPAVDEKYKNKTASYSYSKNNFYLKAIKVIKTKFPEVCIITDVAMDPYSSDGHDGLVINDQIVNDKTLPILAKMAIAQAEAGADIIGPSDMMDGRVAHLRKALDDKGFVNTGIMSYTAKYASYFYNPFRDALDSAPKKGDKKTYQMDFSNVREALIEAELDAAEGADYLMVKPALAYLDVIKTLKDNFALPIAAYNVSGEYAMVKAAAKLGWLDDNKIMLETLTAIKRSGADIILTYFAKQYAQYIST
jgi:porphobilinogen synthase